MKAKTLLLDPKNITISAASGPAAYELIDPGAAAGRMFGSIATVLGTTTNGVFTPNDRMVIGVADDNGGRGAVYLYNTTNGEMLSVLTGSSTTDAVGITGITALSNGNYVVGSQNWNNGAATNADAVSRVEREELQWHIAARPSDIAKLPESRAKTKIQNTEHRKASVRAKVEHPFRVIKRQFGLVKVRFRGLAKNTAHVVTLFALSNLWMVRKQLMAMTGVVRPTAA